MKEEQLYAPVKEYFESLGYEVKAEVGDCDVMAVKDGEIAVTELKLRLNLDVILQATQRQKIAQKVYIATPSPKRTELSRWQKICHVLRRLEIGLILIKNDSVKLMFDCVPYGRAKSVSASRKKRDALLYEFNARHGDLNVGGTNKKLVTAYREQALVVAAVLKKYGTVKICDINDLTDNPKAAGILRANYYGWFAPVSRGMYELCEKGVSETSEYAELTAVLMNELEKE